MIQPLYKDTLSEEAANAMGGRFTFQGVRATFALDDVVKVRGPAGTGEFLITVVGDKSEKDFRVNRSTSMSYRGCRLGEAVGAMRIAAIFGKLLWTFALVGAGLGGANFILTYASAALFRANPDISAPQLAALAAESLATRSCRMCSRVVGTN